MSEDIEVNKNKIRKYWEEVWNNKNLDILDDIYEKDYAAPYMPPWRKPGLEGLKEFIADNFRMFPDVHNVINDLIAADDKVVARVTATATHKGDLVGPVGLVKATGKKISWKGIFIWRFQDGKVVEAWSVTDNMSLMQQLGAVPNPNQ